MAYPESRFSDFAETLHGRTIADPYRWLEDPDSDETRDWVRRQNLYTEEAFAGITERAWFTELMNKIVRRPRAGVPSKRGGKYFVNRNDGTRNQDQWFVADTLEELRAGGRLVLDPNTLSDDGTTSIRGFTVSKDGHYLNYTVSEGGSDWVDFKLIELGTGEHVSDAAIQTKFSGATWLPDNSSFLYSSVPHEGRADGSQAGQVKTGVLKLHRVGEPEESDEVVVDVRAEYNQGFVGAEVSSDKKYVVLYLVEGTERVNRLWVYRITEADGRNTLSEPIKIIDKAYAEFDFVRSDGDTIILYTDFEADRGRIVELDLAAYEKTGELELTELIAETEDSAVGTAAAGDELLVLRLVDVQPVITRYGLDGTELGAVDVTGGSVVGWWADPDSDEWFVGLSTVTSPTRAYRVQTGSGAVEVLDDLVPSGAGFIPPEVRVERRRATSKDGTEVPYFLITPQSPEPVEGPRPTLLYGYGGFTIPVEADYRPVWPGWLTAGGVIAIANLRGGTEYGRSWYEGGRLANKQNVFDDFIAIGEHLIETGVTSHDQLAIHGRSNGGLLVGATMTQRPDLAAVALPGVGVMDILRFHKFTAGAAWTSDYGNPDDPEDFEIGLAYSPLHNIKPANYPATLIMTGDHDDRVVPAHSLKFAATLQQAQQGDAPVLARIETQTGHGMGKPIAMVAAELADMLAFAAHYTGLVLPDQE
ncbi:prolyl endopeptidase [Microlunatus endophyticus]|uniref:prolyl oligopeptidase n=1 Tax=Microlunatus endophyticus TaxID=1716077 RepID=A0A917SGQ7_9ACTN|nr:prolyl oligopeptidase family serine peptidase [Microlunatus endophyticus]GGL77653.1 prolyl endopeptidase [Microlunatus endophyticus]